MSLVKTDGQRPNSPTPGNDAARAPFLSRLGQAMTHVFNPTKGEWFGPQRPIEPQAPNEVAGRQWNFQPGYNIQIQPRAYAQFGFEQLRALATLDIVRLMIQKRKDQLSVLDWQIRPKVRAGEETRRNTHTDDPRIAELEDFYAEPSPGVTFDQWMRMIVDDLLIIDAPTIYVRRNRGGGLYSLDNMDGSLIAPKIGQDGRPPLPPMPAYQQVIHGQPVADYTAEELIYQPWNLRTSNVYGQSPVEWLALTINMGIRRGISQLSYFSAGTVPDGFVTSPEGWTQTQIEAFQDYIDASLAGQLDKRRQLQVMPHGTEYKEWRQPLLKDEFDEYLQRLVAFAFSYPPTPFIKTQSRGAAESQQDQAIDEGREPLKKKVKSIIDRTIRIGHGIVDLEFIWVDKREIDPVKQSTIDASDIVAGIRTRAEVRNDRGLDPMEGCDILTVTTGQGIFPVPSIEALSDAQLVRSAANGSDLMINGTRQTGSGNADKEPPAPKPKKKVAAKAKVADNDSVTKSAKINADKVLSSPEFLAAFREHRKIVRIDDVPYLAGSSKNGKTTYIDKRVPEKFTMSNGKKLDAGKYLDLHEHVEFILMTLFDFPYKKAHPIAEEHEFAAVRADGFDPQEYQHKVDGYIDETEHERATHPPKDLYLKPYDEVREKYLARKERAEKMAKLAKPDAKTLFIMRRLKNADEFEKWAKEQGFVSVVTDPHVTVAFSKTPLDWETIGESYEEVTAGGEKSIDRLGDAVVLRFECEALENRWQQILDCGASWDWPAYKPHVTISYEAPEGLDIDAVEPFPGNLFFAYEIRREVDPGWKDRVKEE